MCVGAVTPWPRGRLHLRGGALTCTTACPHDGGRGVCAGPWAEAAGAHVSEQFSRFSVPVFVRWPQRRTSPSSAPYPDPSPSLLRPASSGTLWFSEVSSPGCCRHPLSGASVRFAPAICLPGASSRAHAAGTRLGVTVHRGPQRPTPAPCRLSHRAQPPRRSARVSPEPDTPASPACEEGQTRLGREGDNGRCPPAHGADAPASPACGSLGGGTDSGREEDSRRCPWC